MERRLQLHEIFTEVLGSRNVYFQPPPDLIMDYPCIVYKRDEADERFADNALYIKRKRYLVTVIDSDPDSIIPDKVAELPLTSFNRHYTSDDLNHDVYALYY